MLGALLGDGIGRSDEDIREKGWLRRANVGKPSTHLGRSSYGVSMAFGLGRYRRAGTEVPSGKYLYLA